MRCSRLWILTLAAAAAAIGCQGEYTLPLAAQAGSTVVIPFMAAGTTEIGYGGLNANGTPNTALTDSQRGMLVYHLNTVDGPALVTRATSTALADPASLKGENPDINGANPNSYYAVKTVVSIVDIPATTPPGAYPLHVTRDVPGQAPIEIAMAHPITLTVLPNTLSGGGSTYTGSSTPFDVLNTLTGTDTTPFTDASPYLGPAVPQPQMRIQLSQPVWAAEVHIIYPAGVINVVDALEPPLTRDAHLASVWFDDNTQNGWLTLTAVATQTAFQTLSFVFTLQNSSTPLKLSDVTPVVTQAWDKNGNVISGGVGITSKQIF